MASKKQNVKRCCRTTAESPLRVHWWCLIHMTEGFYLSLEAPSINKHINNDMRKQVEREVCFWGRSPVILIPLNFTVHHFNHSLPGPPPSRVSLTDGLFNWQWGNGAGTYVASPERVDFCRARYRKPASVSQPDKPGSLIRSSFCPGKCGEGSQWPAAASPGHRFSAQASRLCSWRSNQSNAVNGETSRSAHFVGLKH